MFSISDGLLLYRFYVELARFFLPPDESGLFINTNKQFHSYIIIGSFLLLLLMWGVSAAVGADAATAPGAWAATWATTNGIVLGGKVSAVRVQTTVIALEMKCEMG